MAKKKSPAERSAGKKKDTSGSARKVGLGVSLTAAAVAAAGAYFLYGSERAEENRKKVKSWMLKAKAEVLEALEHAENMTEKEFKELVDNVSSVYASLQNVSKSDVDEFKREMKQHWKQLEENEYVHAATQHAATLAQKVKTTKKTKGKRASTGAQKAKLRAKKTTAKKGKTPQRSSGSAKSTSKKAASQTTKKASTKTTAQKDDI